MHFFLFFLRCILELLILFSLCFCLRFVHHLQNLPQEPELSLARILETGVLPVVTRNTLHTYYIYDEKETGFEYELVKTLADKLDLRLEIQMADTMEEMEEALTQGRAAIAIPGSPALPAESLRTTRPYMYMELELVVHRSKMQIRSPKDIAGMRIHVPTGSDSYTLLRHLQADGLDIELVEESLCGEALFSKVASRIIEGTVIPGHMARRYQRYYPQALPAFALGRPAPFVWLVHPEAHRLHYTINRFLDQILANGTFETLYNHHYRNLDLFDYVDLMRFHQRLESRLPRYQHLFEKYADLHGFDWRLIAAQSYQESHFNPWARSHANARGLMQLMPRTARSLGVTNVHDPEQSIEAGVRYLKNLHNIFYQAEEPHRTYKALGSYNVGQGHMYDARALARRFGLDPNRWYNMEKMLPLLEKKEYYKDATYGYCRGSEPVTYVKRILLYYDIIRHKSLLESRTLPPE
ncbi:membrane-bound lytic murein transglycosylase F [Desulfobotulus alkaliphilus]|uniref:Membrane-bound lytic murein transglycosylase F n=1 Tax=Desulfobotulus alkaliphilus TaxID=622671 RepID=A0A562S647_9BACT|nr:membrane-bound lytic murein transglycosylase MltF [Desulfobotulus alkaliphilus]TWI76787.1 membrane-bound lytic murein transglycosylase F [Desulfobotulus alkaliphilus]